jgi:hypothetical protein
LKFCLLLPIIGFVAATDNSPGTIQFYLDGACTKKAGDPLPILPGQNTPAVVFGAIINTSGGITNLTMFGEQGASGQSVQGLFEPDSFCIPIANAGLAQDDFVLFDGVQSWTGSVEN